MFLKLKYTFVIIMARQQNVWFFARLDLIFCGILGQDIHKEIEGGGSYNQVIS